VYVGAGVASIVNAGNFVTATEYVISTPGNTNFTLVGAADNSIGTSFVANGVGTGNGAAIVTPEAGTVFITNVGNSCITATNWKFASTKYAPTTSGNYVVEVEYIG